MEMQGRQHISADRWTVWNALNDPDVLKACIPGCQELARSSDSEMTASAIVTVGPIRARFQGVVRLTDLRPPDSYRITGEGQGGAAGFARGTAVVRLESADDGTVLYYDVDAQIGGKLSQLGGRLIDATAKKLSGLFFEKLGQEIVARQQPPSALAGAPSDGLGTGIREGIKRHDQVEPISSAHRPNASPSYLQLVMAAALGGAMVFLWLQYGHLLPGITTAPDTLTADRISPDFTAAVQLVMAAAIGYLFGTRRYRNR